MNSRLFHFLVQGFRPVPVLGLSLLTGWLSAAPARGADITVFAAASLIDSLKEAATGFEKQTSDKIYFNFAASSVLEKQIEEGAPADIFFSADEAKMDALEKKGLVVKETRKDRLSNSLVIVTAANSKVDIHSAADLAGDKVRRLALADPKAVPAGIYARAFLEKEKLWPAVEPKVIPTDNVRAALAAVESGNVEAGIVFKTDAAISKKVKIAYAIAPEDGPVIRYPLALIQGSKQVAAARKFLQYLDSDDAAKVFRKYGFIVLK